MKMSDVDAIGKRIRDAEEAENRRKGITKKFYPLKGDSTRKILRTRKIGQKGRTKLVESWSYRLLEDVYYSIADETLPKGAYFIWSGIRNRYEYRTKEGMLVGMTEEQFENDKRFKKVRLPKELRANVEWSKPKPTDFAPFTGNYIERERQKIVNRLEDGEYK